MVNQTVGIVTNPAPVVREVERPIGSTETTAIDSRYSRQAIENKPAEAGEIESVEFLKKLSLKDFELLKERRATLEKTLAKVVGEKELAKGRQRGLLSFAREVLAKKEDKEIRGLVEEIRSLQEAMEVKIATPPASTETIQEELALQMLRRYSGGKVADEVLRDPVKVRDQVVGLLRKKLDLISKERQKVVSEIKKTRDEKVLVELRAKEASLKKGEELFSQSIVHSEAWIRELEKAKVAKELKEEFDTEEVRFEVAGDSSKKQPQVTYRKGIVGIQSVEPDGRYEAGVSEYVPVDRSEGSGPLVGLASVDLTGTNLTMIVNSGQIQQEAKKTKKIVDMLLKRLLAGDLRALDLALIMLAHKGSMKMADVGAKLLKSLDTLDQHYDAVTKQLGSLSAKDPTFSSKIASVNIQSNRIASDRVMLTNLLRDVAAGVEETQNIAKSWLDVQGSQIRYLSRFNS